MSANIAAFLYLVSGVLFILALRGLSHPETSRQGNIFGMVGMAHRHPDHAVRGSACRLLRLAPAHRRGGGIGGGGRRGHRPAHPDDGDAAARRRLPLAGRPGGGAGRRRGALCAGGLRHRRARRHPRPGAGRDGLGVAIGAITFTGSVIAFAKLDGNMSGKPIMLPARHLINACLAHRCSSSSSSCSATTESRARFLADRAPSPGARRADHHPDRRRRHAGRRLDAQLLFGLGGGRHRLHARQHGADHHRRAGRLVGRDPVLHHVQGDEPLVHLRHPRRLRRRDGRAGGRRRRQDGQAGLGRGRGLPDEERLQGHHRAGLRHGGGAGPARAARDGRQAEGGGRRGEIRHPPGGRPHARPHERAAGRGQRAL